ncbi:MAG: hypothetical protein AAF193_06270, partial [Bacteroidota bacterium]
VPKVEKWIPERALEYVSTYIHQELPEPELLTIGFYSHAAWLRKQEGHSDNGLNIHAGEMQLLKDLSLLVEQIPNTKIVIFLHPRERKEEVFDSTKAFYSEQFPSTPFEFSDPAIPSSDGFHLVDMGIAVYSTILYERLFCGYKSFIGNYGMTDFPDPDASLSNICFQSFDALKEQITIAKEESRQEFFKRCDLEGYRFDQYPAYEQLKSNPVLP